MKTLLIFGALIVTQLTASAQFSEIRFPLLARDSTGDVDTVHFGLHPQATACIDPLLGEWEMPPDACCGWNWHLCVVFLTPLGESQSCLGLGVKLNLRRFESTSQVDTYYVGNCSPLPVVFHWPTTIVNYFDSCRVRDPFGGVLFNIDMGKTDSLLIRYPFYILTWGPHVTTNIVSEAAAPVTHSLFQNYPNPFNSSTTLWYYLAARRYVTLKVYDVLGREVATLVNGVEESGLRMTHFDPVRLSSGVYHYQLRAEGFTETRKMILQK